MKRKQFVTAASSEISRDSLNFLQIIRVEITLGQIIVIKSIFHLVRHFDHLSYSVVQSLSKYLTTLREISIIDFVFHECRRCIETKKLEEKKFHKIFEFQWEKRNFYH